VAKKEKPIHLKTDLGVAELTRTYSNYSIRMPCPRPDGDEPWFFYGTLRLPYPDGDDLTAEVAGSVQDRYGFRALGRAGTVARVECREAIARAFAKNPAMITRFIQAYLDQTAASAAKDLAASKERAAKAARLAARWRRKPATVTIDPLTP
jgi:hypothetical protein